MTQEEKAREYDAIIKRVTELYENGTTLTREQMEYLFPELRKNEDERIRHALIEFLREAYSRGNAPEECAKWIVWLDQPKKQKPASISCSHENDTEWSEEDERMRNGLISLIQEIKLQPLKRMEDWDGYIHFLKSLRPSWKPSKEQIKALKIARSFVVDDFSENPTLSEILKTLQEQLEKLRYERICED